MIKFENVTKQYTDEYTAVDGLSLDIKKGEFFVLIGPSGCGKTTTLKMMNRLIPLSGGTIFIDGKKISDYNINALRWNIGYVLQQIALFPHMTIEENIAIVPELKKWNRDKIRDRVTELLEMVGLDAGTYRNRKPDELSGGEQQRVGVVRALAADPEIILMDEPFSALDPISREKLQDDMIHLQQTIQKTIVFVTHDIREALKLADRICIMKDGVAIQIGTPTEIIHQPANAFVRDFVGGEEQHELEINLEKYVQPLGQHDSPPEVTVPCSTSLHELLEQLSRHETVGVQKEKTMIGTINRQTMIGYIYAQMGKRGVPNESLH